MLRGCRSIDIAMWGIASGQEGMDKMSACYTVSKAQHGTVRLNCVCLFYSFKSVAFPCTWFGFFDIYTLSSMRCHFDLHFRALPSPSCMSFRIMRSKLNLS